VLPATPGAARRFIAAATLLVAIDASGQATARLPRVGFCSPGIPEAQLVNYAHPIPQALLAGMRERGWHHEQNYRLVFRTAVGRVGGMAACIDSLVQDPVDVIVVPGSVKLASERAGRIPVVGTIEGALARSLAAKPDPRRSFTGVMRDPSEGLWHKQLAMLKEAGGLERIVILSPWHPARDIYPGLQREKPEELRNAERAVGVTIDRWRLTAPDQIEEACATIARRPRSGLLIGDSHVWVTWGPHRPERSVVEHCVDRHRLPIMYAGVTNTGTPGVLLGYGPSFGGMLRLLPFFIDRILKGAKPADLPIQFVEDYQLGLNVGVARQLGITFTPSLLLRADFVYDGDKAIQGSPRKVPY